MIITFRVDDKAARLFKLYAKENNTSVSELLRKKLTECIEKDYKKTEERKEAEEKKTAI